MTSTYLLPIDLRHGRDAQALVASGEAAPLAGLPVAFTTVERIVREGDAVRRERLPWRELAGDPALARLTSPRPAPFVRPLLMGILNVTPDSFARDTRFPLWEDAVAHGLRLIEEGADIVDVGGESTRPGAAETPLEEELRRVLPVVRRLAETGTTVSTDTRKAAVMREAVAAGAAIINDVSGLAHDRASAGRGRWERGARGADAHARRACDHERGTLLRPRRARGLRRAGGAHPRRRGRRHRPRRA